LQARVRAVAERVRGRAGRAEFDQHIRQGPGDVRVVGLDAPRPCKCGQRFITVACAQGGPPPFEQRRDIWVSFDGGRVPGDAVYPMPLEALP